MSRPLFLSHRSTFLVNGVRGRRASLSLIRSPSPFSQAMDDMSIDKKENLVVQEPSEESMESTPEPDQQEAGSSHQDGTATEQPKRKGGRKPVS